MLDRTGLSDASSVCVEGLAPVARILYHPWFRGVAAFCFCPPPLSPLYLRGDFRGVGALCENLFFHSAIDNRQTLDIIFDDSRTSNLGFFP